MGNETGPRNLSHASYKKGGRVKKTGLAKVHRGEEVVPAGKAKKVRKAMRNMKRKGGR